MVRMRTISNQSRHDKREPRTDISQVELQLHGLRDAARRGLHQLRREDRGAGRAPLPGASDVALTVDIGSSKSAALRRARHLPSQNFPLNLPTNRRLCSTLGGRITAS
jgi:hypothetical protein